MIPFNIDNAQMHARRIRVFALQLSIGLTVVLGAFLDAAIASPFEPSSADGESKIVFNRDIRPILSEYCLACHGFDPNHRASGLRLDQREGALSETDSGTHAIVPEHPEMSELMARIATEDASLRMPPVDSGKQLSTEQIAMLRTWIKQGAPYEPHWAFTPISKPVPPSIETGPFASGWGNPVDLFINAELERIGLTPSGVAPPATLIRRVHLDLVGLPPTVAEVAAFEEDFRQRGNAAFSDVVDKLLSSPHYGERWGRWWLDQARYADSNGYSIDSPRSIWPYRDWVVNAFNSDQPFDQFVVEQLAGDLLPSPTQEQIVATGFHRNTQFNEEGGIDPEQFRIERVFDRVATTGTVFLGLTVGCAQCHDHKFDPISHREYYRMFAFFNDQDEPMIKVHESPEGAEETQRHRAEVDKVLKEQLKSYQDRLQLWEAELDDEARAILPAKTAEALKTAAGKRNMQQQTALLVAMLTEENADAKTSLSHLKTLLDIDRAAAEVPSTLVMKERSEPRTTNIYVQGDFTRPADRVEPGTLEILHPLQPQKPYANRLDLANWIVAPENPLTARVLVNRVWKTYFGRGIVETENDFGLQSSVPTHPELLDWLASYWRNSSLQFKELHRQIVCSDVYMRDSTSRADLLEVDRNNHWLARQIRIRLDAELVRDVGLVASGLFSSKVGGAPVYPPIPDGVMNQGQVRRSWKASTGEDRYRRGLYTFLYRATPPPMLNVFDAPEGNATCTQRNRSNTPLQALTMLNDLGQFEFAKSLQRIIETDGIVSAFQRCTARTPSEDELQVLSKLDSLSIARVLLNLDETITRE